MASQRLYDFVLLGATGYTGRICAQYLSTTIPTNIKWAVAGRSASKLHAVCDDLKKVPSASRQPDVVSVQFDEAELNALAQNARILLNCTGPYHLYSTPVVKACALNGTHYLDVSGETPWLREIITQFHEIAKSNNAVIIPEVGFESVPSDIVTYASILEINKAAKTGILETTCSVHELKGAGMSGGSLTSGLSLINHYSFSKLWQAFTNPFVLSPSPAPPYSRRPSDKGVISRILGPLTHPNLGLLTTSITALPNIAVIHRSSGLLPELYGRKFLAREYMRVSSYRRGVIVRYTLILGTILLALRPIRSIAKRYIYLPGEGPASEKAAKDVVEWRAVSVADEPKSKPGSEMRAWASLRFEGGIYLVTSLFMVEAAMLLLEEQDSIRKRFGGGGVLTSACLGPSYIERLRKANVKIASGICGATGFGSEQ